MITPPELYYDRYIKGKDENELIELIYKIKQRIISLKNAIEHPDPNITEFCHPTDSVRLLANREYLQLAKQALLDIGGTYIASKAENKALLFDASIPAISKIIFSIGGYFEGYETRTITVHEDCIYLYIEHSLIPRPSNLPNGLNSPCTKAELLDGIKKLHIGEWETNYLNSDILDGTQWELTIEFSNEHEPFESGGSNNYPFDFEEFLRFLCVDVLIHR